MVTLTPNQKTNIARYIDKFKEFMNTPNGREWQDDRKQRRKLFSRIFGKEHIDKISEEEFKNILKMLWATGVWTNKEFKASQIVQKNGMERIRKRFKDLLYGDRPFRERYEDFRRQIFGLGISSISEILVFVAPDKYCLWNKTPINSLPFLKMKELLPKRVWNTWSVDGKSYEGCTKVLELIKNELETRGLPNLDFVGVDFYLRYLLEKVMPIKEEVEKAVKHVEEILEEIKLPTTHEEAEGTLLKLGNLHGFDTYVCTRDRSKKYTDRTLGEIASLEEIPEFTFREKLEVVREIDVIWFTSEGYPEYCFEVEHTTKVRDGLLRLYQISPLKGVKLFIIAPSAVLSKFQTEVSRSPFTRIKDRYNFRSYEELAVFHDVTTKYYGKKQDFGID